MTNDETEAALIELADAEDETDAAHKALDPQLKYDAHAEPLKKAWHDACERKQRAFAALLDAGRVLRERAADACEAQPEPSEEFRENAGGYRQ